MRGMIGLLNPHVCIYCGGQLVHHSITTTYASIPINPATGYADEDNAIYTDADDYVSDDYLECNSCGHIFEASYIIDEHFAVEYTLDKFNKKDINTNKEANIFLNNPFYKS